MFSSICLHWSLIRLSYLSLLFFGTAFKWIYLSFSPLPFTSFLLSSIFKPPWTTILPFNLYYFLPGASVRNPTHGKGHEEGSPTKRKGVIWLQGFPLSFPEHPPPKTRVGLILLYCAFHSSDVLWKKLIQGFSLLHMKGMFQLKPFWWLSNLPDRFPQTFYNLWIIYSPPTAKGTKLKAS